MAVDSSATSTEDARAVAEQFFRALTEGDFATYLSCLSTERKRNRGQEWLRGRFAKFAQLQVQSWQIVQVLPQTPQTVWVKYQITYHAGAKRGEDELELIIEGNNWKIERGDFC